MRPHERTLSGPKADRLKLFRASAANLSLGFLATRLLHPVLYLANLDILRSLAFVVGIACAIGLLAIAA